MFQSRDSEKSNTINESMSGVSKTDSTFIDNREDVIALKKLQGVANNQKSVIQCEPIEKEDENGIYTDTRYGNLQMKLIKEIKFVGDIFELLDENGKGRDKFVLWHYEEPDNYYLSDSNGTVTRDLYFVEDELGNEISDEYEEDLKAVRVGEFGIGLRAAKGKKARLSTKDLMSCIAIKLKSENSIFICHVIVPKNVEESVFKSEIKGIQNKFVQQSGEEITKTTIVFGTSYKDTPEWLKWHDNVIGPRGHTKTKVTGSVEQSSLMWRTPIVKMKASKKDEEEKEKEPKDEVDSKEQQKI